MLTGLGRGARFAIRLRLVERTSFDARVYNQTSSLLKTLFVSRSWVLGERHIAKALSNDVVRRRTEVACLWGSAARHCRRIAQGKKACPHQPLGHRRRRGPYGAQRSTGAAAQLTSAKIQLGAEFWPTAVGAFPNG